MSYTVTDKSTEDAQPVELYKFSAKLGVESYTYTSGNEPYEHAGDTYEPAPMKRTSLSVSGKASSGSLKVTVSRDNVFARRYLASHPPLPDELEVFRVHTSDATDEVITYWKGDVDGVGFEGETAKISLTTLYQRLQRAIPKRTYSWACNHVLYDGGCKAAKASHRSDVEVQSLTSTETVFSIRNDSDWSGTAASSRLALDTLYFNGGYVEHVRPDGSQEFRTIMNLTHDTLEMTLNLPILGLSANSKLKLFAGCNHAVQTCKSKFNNVQNYGGCPFVPSANPFSTGVITEYSTPKA